MTVEEQIFDQLKTTLEASLTWVTRVEKDRPFVDISDLGNADVPLVQFFWDGDSVQTQQRGLTTTAAPFLIEVVAKDTYLNDMTQAKIFQYRKDVLDAVSSVISLPAVPGFIHFSYNGRNYDVHSFTDYYIAQLRMSALFNEPFGNC